MGGSTQRFLTVTDVLTKKAIYQKRHLTYLENWCIWILCNKAKYNQFIGLLHIFIWISVNLEDDSIAYISSKCNHLYKILRVHWYNKHAFYYRTLKKHRLKWSLILRSSADGKCLSPIVNVCGNVRDSGFPSATPVTKQKLLCLRHAFNLSSFVLA